MTVFVMSACSEGDQPSTDVSNGSNAERTTLPSVDRAGNAIEIPENIETIVSLAPSITQVLEDLGVEDKLVAIDSWTATLSGHLADLPQVDMMSPNMELLLSLNPDIVFASEISFGMNETIFQVLIDAGITVVKIPTSDSIQGIKEDNQFIADCLQLSAEGQALNDEMEEVIETISQIADKVSEPKTVLFEIAPHPDIFSFGQNVFLNEMIEIIGAENVLADQEWWLSVSEEVVLDLNPDVILTNVNFIEDPVGEILSRNGWADVEAVKNEAVHYIDNDSSSLPNHRIVLALKEMARAIYPEEFAAIEDQLK